MSKDTETPQEQGADCDLPEARIEHRHYAIAYCPKCDAEHDVPTCDSGEITCICDTRFFWSTVE
ncbi:MULTISPECIES: hypothetical protein [Vibrio]|uniref:Uncharacterized protein n=1 Tax=Vibrio jasicida TaxID=766224 RepID=A0AAU9QV31_9VIBR|nr:MULTISPECIES: hypothetical protein [Vibrio]MCZ2799045.1 hypothetical protein [Vibrio alginolyticus]NOH36945.1 hypothetical protein [Vibrio coralliilyticus]CAH1588264.1 hypothetical protein THF1C08_30103 [Vibrio jasicida]CAH1599873.1 hypothetical protein THF1A12_40332 [Vibrio jasicida]